MLQPPNIPRAPDTYDAGTFEALLTSFRQFFARMNVPYPHYASILNINIATLPTEAALATIKSGDVYRDTTAGNVLKVKP